MEHFLLRSIALLLLISSVQAASNSSLCSGTDICGSYGICDSGSCSCPNTFVLKSSSNSFGGCQKGSGYTTAFIKITGVTFSSSINADKANGSTPSDSECLSLCSADSTCYGAFFNGTGQSCYLAYSDSGELGTLLAVKDQSYVAYLWVGGMKKSSVGAIVGGIVGAFLFLIFVGLVALYFFKYKKKDLTAKKAKEMPLEIGLRIYTYVQIKEMTNSFSKSIGEGGFATVYRGWTAAGTDVAVKVLKEENGEFTQEISILAMIRHWNLVELVGYCYEGSHRILVYEYMSKGSLETWIFKNTDCPLSWECRFNILLGVANGMVYLHEQCRSKVLHLDLKPQNILLDAQFNAKVADFGLSRLLSRDESMIATLTIRGTPTYIAPECVTGGNITDKSDVYSFGVIMLEIIGGKRITHMSGRTLSDAVSSFERQDYFPSELVDPFIINSVDKTQAKRVIQIAFLCMQGEPFERPSMSAVLQMLQGIVAPILNFYQQRKLKDNFSSRTSTISSASSGSGHGSSASTSGPTNISQTPSAGR